MELRYERLTHLRARYVIAMVEYVVRYSVRRRKIYAGLREHSR